MSHVECNGCICEAVRLKAILHTVVCSLFVFGNEVSKALQWTAWRCCFVHSVPNCRVQLLTLAVSRYQADVQLQITNSSIRKVLVCVSSNVCPLFSWSSPQLYGVTCMTTALIVNLVFYYSSSTVVHIKSPLMFACKKNIKKLALGPKFCSFCFFHPAPYPHHLH